MVHASAQLLQIEKVWRVSLCCLESRNLHPEERASSSTPTVVAVVDLFPLKSHQNLEPLVKAVQKLVRV